MLYKTHTSMICKRSNTRKSQFMRNNFSRFLLSTIDDTTISFVLKNITKGP